MKYLVLILLLSTGCKSIEVRVACKYKDVPFEVSFKPEFKEDK